MNRFQYMTTGLVLVFLGVQFYFAETYILTQEVSAKMGKKDFDPDPIISDTDQYGNAGVNFYSASYSTSLPGAVPESVAQKEISPPSWLCWPILCLGAVFFLHALSMPESSGGDHS